MSSETFILTFNIVLPDTGVSTQLELTINPGMTGSIVASMSGDGNTAYGSGFITGKILSPDPQVIPVEVLNAAYTDLSKGNFYIRFKPSQTLLNNVNSQIQVDRVTSYSSYYNSSTNPAITVFTVAMTNYSLKTLTHIAYDTTTGGNTRVFSAVSTPVIISGISPPRANSSRIIEGY
jgi:hypothetical protein